MKRTYKPRAVKATSKSVKKEAGLVSNDKKIDALGKAAGNELLRTVNMNSMKYTVAEILKIVGTEVMPNLAKLEKKCPGSTVINMGGMPLLRVRLNN